MSGSKVISNPTPTAVCWSTPLTMKLIDLYRQNPCLWNVKLDVYKDRNKRSSALKVIAAELRK